jgi:two-component system sensor histidine kinase YesM
VKKKQERIFLYHRSSHRQIIHTIIVPIIIIGAVIIAVLPVVISLVINANNSAHNQREAASFYSCFSRFYPGMEEIAGSEPVRTFLRTGAGKEQVYDTLYRFRNSGEIRAVFQLCGYDGKYRVEDPLPGQVRSYDALRDPALLWKLRESPDVTENIVFEPYGWSRISRPLPALALNVNDETGVPLGCLVFLFIPESIDSLISEGVYGTVVVNKSGHVAYTDIVSLNFGYNKFIPQKIFMNIAFFDGRYFIISQSRIKETGFWIYSLSSFNFLFPLMYGEAVLAAALIAVMAFIVYRFSYRVVDAVLSPFDDIFTALDQYRNGNRLNRIPNDKGDELYPYISQFNTMLDEIDRLLEENKELLERNKTAEIKALHSQFSPHFIFNMLDTIKYLSFSDPEQACSTIVTLSRMLRYTLSHGALVSLKEDIKYIEDYLELQRMRLGELFAWNLDVKEEAENCRIPRLIMQPVIENCVSHGYTGEQPFFINIEASVSDGGLRVIVRDNGRGIEPEQLKSLRRCLEDREYSAHIGMANTHRRLRLHYGGEYGLTIQSEPGQGTTVSLALKAVKE